MGAQIKSKDNWYVYVLLCLDGSLYTGSSNNPNKRLKDHMNGKGAKYTKSHRVLKMIYCEKLGSKSAALKKEMEIKNWTRQKKIKNLKIKPSNIMQLGVVQS